MRHAAKLIITQFGFLTNVMFLFIVREGASIAP